MDYTIVTTCEYIYDEQDCISYLTCIHIDPIKYEYIYKEYNIDDDAARKYKKKVRKLVDVTDSNITQYTNVMSIRLYNKFNKSFRIPTNILCITFGQYFNCTINHLPNKLIYLKYDEHFNQQLTCLPSHLIYLILGNSYYFELPILPSTLRYLRLERYFYALPKLSNNLITLIVNIHNHGLLNNNVALPTSLRALSLHSKLLPHIKDIPQGLHSLFLNINNILPPLPNGLIQLCLRGSISYDILLPSTIKLLDWDCNRHLPILPNNLTSLIIGRYVKHNLKQLPPSLRFLSMYYYSGVFFELSSNLIHLDIWCYTNDITISELNTLYERTKTLPNELRKLYWYSDIKLSHLPSKLMYVFIGSSYNHELPEIPNSLLELNIGCNFNCAISKLSNKLLYLALGNSFNKYLPELPTTLKHLELGDSFNQVLPNLPSTLKHLELGDSFNQILPNLPSTLEHLKLGLSYSRELVIPSGLHTLIWRCKQQLPKLPRNLKVLKLGEVFNHKIHNIPHTVKKIEIHSNYKYKDNLIKRYKDRVVCRYV
jgi:hypothetical protein